MPPSGADVLLRLSAEAANQSSPPWPAATPYAYVRVRSWSLRTHTAQSKVRPATSAAWRSRGEVPALSASAPVLARLLATGSRSGGWAPGWEFVDLARLTQSRPVPGAAQAVLLRILSAIPGVVNQGTTTDRAGRIGAAVSLDSSYSGEPITYTLIFDPGHRGAAGSRRDALRPSAPPRRAQGLGGLVHDVREIRLRRQPVDRPGP